MLHPVFNLISNTPLLYRLWMLSTTNFFLVREHFNNFYLNIYINKLPSWPKLHMTGVISVVLEGDDKDRVVVIGENVNTICLINQLNKKFRCVTVLTVEEVKPEKPKEPPKQNPPKKDDKKEEKPCCAVLCLPAPVCAKCESKCEHCSKCQSPKCQCKCVIICFKCKSPKCDGQCVICINCQSPKCSGQCGTPCKPPPPPPQPCHVQCPPWCTCPRCYVPCIPPPCTYQVVYESNPDNCSIMWWSSTRDKGYGNLGPWLNKIFVISNPFHTHMRARTHTFALFAHSSIGFM